MLQIPLINKNEMKAGKVFAGQKYRSRTGMIVYIYPSSKIPNCCGPCPQKGHVPYRAERSDGYIFYGYLSPDYLLQYLES